MKKFFLIFALLCFVKLAVPWKNCDCPERKKIMVRHGSNITMAYPVMRYIPCITKTSKGTFNYMIVCLDKKFVKKYFEKGADKKSVAKDLIESSMNEWDKKDVYLYKFRDQDDKNTLYHLYAKNKATYHREWYPIFG